MKMVRETHAVAEQVYIKRQKKQKMDRLFGTLTNVESLNGDADLQTEDAIGVLMTWLVRETGTDWIPWHTDPEATNNTVNMEALTGGLIRWEDAVQGVIDPSGAFRTFGKRRRHCS